jgi:predicted outer membrane protein
MKKMMAMAAVVLLAGGATTQSHTGGVTRYSLLTEPSAFAAQAASDRAGQEAMAQLALTRAKSHKVQEFSKQLLDHDAADDQLLKALAQQHGIAFPAPVSDANRYRLDALGKVAHGEFDRIYMDTMVDMLRDANRLYTTASRASSPEVAGYAKQAAGSISTQLEQAQRIDIAVGGGLGPVSGYN